MLRKTLEPRGYAVEEAADAYEARRRLQASRFLVVVTDLRLPAGSGFDVLQAAREADAQTPVIVMTAFGTVEEAVRAMKEGAADFLTKPVDTEHLLVLLERAMDRRRLLTNYVLLQEDYQRRFGLPRLVGEDPAFKETLLSLQRAAASEATVLLLGESGTGKELLSRALHQLSPRAKGPFVAINCAAIPEALLENELFGHEKGAFTGATGRKVGKAELAHRGHALPGRDRRPAAVPAGQDPAARAGAAVRARRRRADAERGRARGGGHQPRPPRGGGREGVPRGPVLPALRVPGRDPAAAPAPRRHPPAGGVVPRALRAGARAQGHAPLGGGGARAARPPLARQRPRAAELPGAGRHPVRRLGDPAAAPAPGRRRARARRWPTCSTCALLSRRSASGRRPWRRKRRSAWRCPRRREIAARPRRGWGSASRPSAGASRRWGWRADLLGQGKPRGQVEGQRGGQQARRFPRSSTRPPRGAARARRRCR